MQAAPNRTTTQPTPKPPKHRITAIEAGRGIAAVFVIFYHVAYHINDAYKTPHLRQLFQFGHAGVDFFFVISGFIILYVHYDDVGVPNRLSRYIGRRFTRLMPTYWVVFAISIVMTLAGHHALPSLFSLTWQAFLLPSNGPMVLGVAWTLRCEILFYAIFCILILNRWVGIAALAAWFGLVAICAVTGAKPTWLPGQFYTGYAIEFLFGMIVAYVAKNHTIHKPGAILTAGLGLYGLSALLEDLHLLNGYADPARLAYGIPSALTILGLVTLSQRKDLKIPTLFSTLGAASYSLYLFQFVFIGTAWQILLKSHLAAIIPPLAQFCLLVLTATIGGVIASSIIEKPLIRFLRNRRQSLVARQSA